MMLNYPDMWDVLILLLYAGPQMTSYNDFFNNKKQRKIDPIITSQVYYTAVARCGEPVQFTGFH